MYVLAADIWKNLSPWVVSSYDLIKKTVLGKLIVSALTFKAGITAEMTGDIIERLRLLLSMVCVTLSLFTEEKHACCNQVSYRLSLTMISALLETCAM